MLVQLKIQSETEKAYKVVLVYNTDYETKQQYNTFLPKSTVSEINGDFAEVKDGMLYYKQQELVKYNKISRIQSVEQTFSI